MTAAEGLSWDWESYPEYLDAVEFRPHDINVASYLPHSALRDNIIDHARLMLHSP